MIDAELVSKAFANLRQQRLRSFLTLLGVVIGIAAIVALISLGNGMNLAVKEQFEKMGSNTIIILPGKDLMTSPFAELGSRDAERVESVVGVESATPIYMETVSIGYKSWQATILVVGIDPKEQTSLAAIGMLELAEGRELEKAESTGVLAGNRFVKKAFDSEISLRERVNIFGKEFKIVGITKAQGRSFGAMLDNAVIMNKDALEAASGIELTPKRIIVKAFSADELDEVSARIKRALKRAHGEEDFQIMAASQIQETALSIIGLIQIILVGLAAIALVVGGIGIMNTMLMAVIERTREIGVMKAIGATNKKVLGIFLMEAGMIGLVGGFIGLALGAGAAFGVSALAGQLGFGLPVAFDPLLAVMVLGFAMFIGMASGFVPARRAALLDPVEALRQNNH